MTTLLKYLAALPLALILSFFASDAFAAEEGAITCQMHGGNARNWIPPLVAVIVNDKGQVTVSDPIILHFYGLPVRGKIAVENEQRITYAWTLEGARDSRRQYAPAIDYRLTVQKGPMTATMTVVPRNYANTLHGQGNCASLMRK